MNDIYTIYNSVISNFDIDEDFLEDILISILFRLNKNSYHFSNIKNFIESNSIKTDNDTIYYECENILINCRSLVDNLLQLVNLVYDLNLTGLNINLKNVLTHRKCDSTIKDLFFLYTSPRNKNWNFVYTGRNEIVHEVCIKTRFPIVIDEFFNATNSYSEIYFINKNDSKENLLIFYSECINLMDEFTKKIMYTICK